MLSAAFALSCGLGYASALPSCESLRFASIGPDASVISSEQKRTFQGVQHCLVKTVVKPAINIWVGLPSDGSYNERFMALGGGGFCGTVGAPEKGVNQGYAAAETDTGHTGGSAQFAMKSPGVPNVELQQDFAYKSLHDMVVVSKNLIKAFYGQAPKYSYWNGCSTGGRQGNMMAQKYPDDFDGILAGSAAVHNDKICPGQLWPQVAMHNVLGKPLAGSKRRAAVSAAVAECDHLDGVVDGRLRDPRACHYDANSLLCKAGDGPNCLTAQEAKAVNMIWSGPTTASGDQMWYGVPHGADLDSLAGGTPNFFPTDIAKYFVYQNPNWNWQKLDFQNWQAFFDQVVRTTQPLFGTDFADYSRFKNHGGKILMWHGWGDGLITAEGTIDLYDSVVNYTSHGSLRDAQSFARLFLAPGIGHCGMNDDIYFKALVAWVEQGRAPDSLAAGDLLLCKHPEVAIYKGSGSSRSPSSYYYGQNTVGADTESLTEKANMRIFGRPFLQELEADITV